jgi:hypothetical protein
MHDGMICGWTTADRSVLTDDGPGRKLNRIGVGREGTVVMTQVGVRGVTKGLALLLVALVGSTWASASPARNNRWIPPLPVSTSNEPVEPLPLSAGGVRLVTSGLDLTPADGATAMISMSRSLAILDKTGDLPHRASGFGGRLVRVSDGDWGAGQASTFTNRLSWLVVFVETPVMSFGTAVEPRLIARFYVPPFSVYDDVMAGFACTDYRLVDATTGVFFATWQACEHRAPSV